jgi:glucose-1-phosphate cytidylyltransferase
MKAVILAGGLGTRLSEETATRPKPMVEIGGKPILWHIMKMYSHHGINDFIVCCGFKGYLIKEYFANYSLHTSDVTFDLKENKVLVHHKQTEPWRVTLVDTGEETQTGGRLRREKENLDKEESFCMTYGDGVSDIIIAELIIFHNSHGKHATVTAVYPPGRYGSLAIDGINVNKFDEKPLGDGGRISGGFFVLSPKIFNYIDGDKSVFETHSISQAVAQGQMAAYLHDGFWQAMDTLRDKNLLEDIWGGGRAPWKNW